MTDQFLFHYIEPAVSDSALVGPLSAPSGDTPSEAIILQAVSLSHCPNRDGTDPILPDALPELPLAVQDVLRRSSRTRRPGSGALLFHREGRRRFPIQEVKVSASASYLVEAAVV